MQPALQKPEQAISDCLAAGLNLCVIPTGEKNPTDHRWQLRRRTNPRDFIGHNVGIVCGPLSRNLLCVDLDGIDSAVADRHLPPTAMEDGRPGRLRAHRWYSCFLEDFADSVLPGAGSDTRAAMDAGLLQRFPGSRNMRSAADRSVGVEIKGAGTQATIPPSTTKSGPREWSNGQMGKPAPVRYADLLAAVEGLARAIGWLGGRTVITSRTHKHAMLGLRDWEILARAEGAKNGAKFRDLWNRLDATSEDDAALIGMLAFWSNDPAQVERLWLSSPCGGRSKTQERGDYRSRTLTFVLGSHHG